MNLLDNFEFSQYFLSQEDIGKNRAISSAKQLAELNPYVKVQAHTGILTEQFIAQFQVVVLTESTLQEQLKISELTHSNGICLVIATSKGVFG